MGITLVFPGNHYQYMTWLRQRPAVVATTYREIIREDQLRGIGTDQIDNVVLVGSYVEDNEVWDSDEYRMLMADAESLGKPWARRPHEDWEATKPPSPEAMSAARQRLEQLENELSEGEE